MESKKQIPKGTADAVTTGGIRDRLTALGGVRDIAVRVKNEILRHRRVLVRAVLPAAYCLIFSRTGFEMGIYPFGVSAVCAAASGFPAVIAALGAAVSSMFVRGGFYITAAAAAGAASLAAIRRFRGDTADFAVLRGALSMTLGAAQATAFALPGGIGFYELCGILLSAALCPVITVGLRGLFCSAGTKDISVEAGIYVLIYTAAYHLRWLSPVGESVATAVGIMGVLAAVRSFGVHKGAVAGIALGLAADPKYSLIYAVAAVSAGALMGISPMAAVTAGVILAMAVAIGSAGASAFGELFPELMLAAAVAGPLLHYGIIPVYGISAAISTVSPGDGTPYLRKRLRALSDSFSAISSAMGKLSRITRKPSAAEMRQMCDEAFDESCIGCAGCNICWDREYRTTAAALGAMAASLSRGRSVDEGYFPEGMRQRCPHSEEILTRIRVGSAALSTAAGTDVATEYADSYVSMSEMLSDLAENDGDTAFDAAASRRLRDRLSSMGLRSADAEVYGKRRHSVVIRGLEKGCSVGGDELKSAAESVLGCAVSEPEFAIDGHRITAKMHTAERFSVRIGRRSVPKKGERSGDSITAFSGDGGYFYALISDGMGSGGEAALTSGISAVFLERMLSAGCTLKTALGMLNSFLVRRRAECFTTVDLMEADLVTGELTFVKSGAAPSFVLREGRLFRLSSKTVPMGIVTPYDAERLRFTAKKGDFVVMLSDGAVPDNGDAVWLYEMLCGKGAAELLHPGCDVDAAAAAIAKKACEECSRADDVTVGIMEVTGA